MTASQKAYDLIKGSEGYRSKAYWDEDGEKWTIGYGSTYWPNGLPVLKGQKITQEGADEVLKWHADKVTKEVERLTYPALLNQNQLDALVSFVYNIGEGRFRTSTIRKLIKANPNNPAIAHEFSRWKYSGGKILSGLVERRKKEADYYFKA